MKIKAPWSHQQVERLNAYQESGLLHPFTCANEHEGDRTLVATVNGWICKHCDYRQNWAHSFMERPVKELVPWMPNDPR